MSEYSVIVDDEDGTTDIELGSERGKFYLYVDDGDNLVRAPMGRLDLQKLRAAIGELLEGTMPISTRVHRSLAKAWRELGEARRLATEENDTATAVLCQEHQEILNGLAFVWKGNE